jgi:hypothetical protein
MIYAASLADAVVAHLEAKELGEGVTVARRRLVRPALDGISGTMVSVIPFGPAFTLEAVGGAYQNDLDLRIVVQVKLDGETDDAAADAAAKLTEDIAAALVGLTLLGAECQSAKATPSYDPNQLATLDLFDATIYTIWRAFEDGPGD